MFLRVATRNRIQSRRRAGFDFSPQSTVVEVEGDKAAAILADDALLATELTERQAEAERAAGRAARYAGLPGEVLDELDSLRAENEALRARVAELEVDVPVDDATDGEDDEHEHEPAEGDTTAAPRGRGGRRRNRS